MAQFIARFPSFARLGSRASRTALFAVAGIAMADPGLAQAFRSEILGAHLELVGEERGLPGPSHLARLTLQHLGLVFAAVALAVAVMHLFFCCLSPNLSDRSEAG